MNLKEKPGLGELLRFVGELVEQGAEEHYKEMNLNYRARYTPVLRAMHAGAETVTDITARTHLTQGAISQTVGLMEADGLISRQPSADGRKTDIQLTQLGRSLVKKLEQHWTATFAAIASLEAEIGQPLLQVLEDTAKALKKQGFSERLRIAKTRQNIEARKNAK